MKRLLVVSLVVGILTAVAGSAGAQERDPFVPLVSPEEATGATDGAGQADESGQGSGPGATQDVTVHLTEQMPETGAPISSWAAIAFALVAMGGGLLALGRVMGWARPLPGRGSLTAR